MQAQQTMLFSQHLFNRTFVNPANAGSEEAIRGAVFYRNQWLGLPGSPESQSMTVDVPLFGINGGAGLQLYNDQLGVQQTVSVSGIVSKHKKVGNNLLSIGLRAGYQQVSFDGALLTTPGGAYTDQSVINHNDGVIPNRKISGGAPDLGIGLQYVATGWWAGISADHLLGNTVQLADGGVTSSFALRRHVNLHAGTAITINRQWVLQPGILARTDLKKHQVDVSVLANYNQFLLAGIGFRGYDRRSQDAVIVLLGIKVAPQWMVGYSYDYTISALGDVTQGTHELSLQYRMPVARPRVGKVINNPRFLAF